MRKRGPMRKGRKGVRAEEGVGNGTLHPAIRYPFDAPAFCGPEESGWKRIRACARPALDRVRYHPAAYMLMYVCAHRLMDVS